MSMILMNDHALLKLFYYNKNYSNDKTKKNRKTHNHFNSTTTH